MRTDVRQRPVNTGLLIGAVLGAVFVMVNAQSPLNPGVGTALRVVAIAGAVAVLALWFLAQRQVHGSPAEARQNMFSKGYWIVVAIEAVLLFGGTKLLTAWGVPTQVNVAWVALVVGVHFLGLAPIWKSRSILVPGAVLTALGLAGFAVAAAGSVEWVPLVSGVGSGLALVAGSVWQSLRR
ncbi:hypothetical protein ACIBG8_26235 [Nonomuraea sp. NPDC050556]|uniref:hypothetical protein n=1 Tax=Nonomuraea sp. NPDC050556 TaxID=3364369 RepID=UPI0037A6251A